MIQTMLERLSRYGYSQGIHVGKVTLTLTPGLVLLRKEDLARRPPPRPPYFHAPLQRPQLPFLKLLTMLPAQPFEDRLRFHARVELEHLLDLRPYLGKPILARPVAPRLPRRAWRLASPPPPPRRLLIHSRLGCRCSKTCLRL